MSLFNNLSTLFETGKNGKRKQTRPAKKSGSKHTSDSKKSAKPKRQPQRPAKTKQAQPAPQLEREAQAKAQEIILDAKAKARESIVEAKAEALAIRTEAEKEKRQLVKDLDKKQQSIEDKLDKIDQRLTRLDEREAQLSKQQKKVEQLQASLESSRQEIVRQLEAASGYTKEEAKANLFEQLEQKLSKEMAQMIRQKQEEAEAEADELAQEILIDAMKHGATDYVSEYTVSVVKLPSEDIKGKIIGKNGRNINAFERCTGVDVDLDMSPTEVRLSCYDPVRREIARIALKRLIKDGRIQPTRIEETVEKVRKEFQKTLLEAGKKLCHAVGAYNLHPDLMRMLGRFKYRFSYGQNLITHTMEETKIGIKLAHELGIDVDTVRLGCLLHDIGKVSEEVEGSHVELGIKIAKQFKLPQPVIDCIAQHHEDEPFSGPEQMAVYIADAISGARPGARYENYDEYVKRLTQLEEIATKYDEVESAYAIQAGREVRVLLNPEHSKDDDVVVLSTKIRDEIKDTMTYPGTVTVNVIRESRAQSVAK